MHLSAEGSSTFGRRSWRDPVRSRLTFHSSGQPLLSCYRLAIDWDGATHLSTCATCWITGTIFWKAPVKRPFCRLCRVQQDPWFTIRRNCHCLARLLTPLLCASCRTVRMNSRSVRQPRLVLPRYAGQSHLTPFAYNGQFHQSGTRSGEACCGVPSPARPGTAPICEPLTVERGTRLLQSEHVVLLILSSESKSLEDPIEAKRILCVARL